MPFFPAWRWIWLCAELAVPVKPCSGGTSPALCLLAALLMIAPGLTPTLIGLLLASPVLLRHILARRRLLAA